MKHTTYFITGIDTNVGKTIVTGILAKELLDAGEKVITQKMIQTGNIGYSEDIEKHREIMQIPLTEADKSMLTAPCIRSYPCSPHLAAAIDNQPIDVDAIRQATKTLESQYDIVLLEGAGGIMVPITHDMLTIDYVAQENYPILLVTSGILGSLNHTLLTLHAIKERNLELHTLFYNRYPSADATIEEDSIVFLQRWLAKHFPKAQFRIIERMD